MGAENTEQRPNSATHSEAVIKLCSTQPTKGLMSYIPSSEGRINKCGLSGYSCENWQHVSTRVGLRVKSHISSISIT